MPTVVRHFCGIVDGIDVASAGEMDVALAAGAQPDRVSFAGPGKTPAELERAVAAGIIVNMESELEMRRMPTSCAASVADLGLRSESTRTSSSRRLG